MPAVRESLSFELDPLEAQIVELNGLDDYICCYEGASDDDLWEQFLLAGARALGERMGKRELGQGFRLEDDDLVFAYACLRSMREDSPLDGCSQEYRERAYALIERLEESAYAPYQSHWERIWDEERERDERRREIEAGEWREPGSPQPPQRPRGLC